MSGTTVVHCKRSWHNVYIGRPSKWDNPFQIGPDGDREAVNEKFEAWILGQPHLLGELHELQGKRLGCWRAPKSCHGEILARLADSA